MKQQSSFFLFALILLLLNCAAQTNFEPMGENEFKVNASIGGPIISAFGARIPIPYATVGADYGLSDRININGNVHLLSLAYKIMGLDAGAAWFPLLNEGFIPTVGLQPRALILASLKSDVPSRFRIYPLLTGTAAWNVGKNTCYTGFDVTLPLTGPDYDKEAQSIILSPFLGYCWKLGTKTRFIMEFKWQGANIRSDQLAVEYVPIAGYGAVTTLFSIERGF